MSNNSSNTCIIKNKSIASLNEGYKLIIRGVINGAETDISGDFNEYSFTEKTEINHKLVTMKGKDGKVKVAVWSDGTYNYSIDSAELLAEDEMTELVAELK